MTGWLQWLRVLLLIPAQVMISWLVSLSPALGFELTVQILFRILSLSLSLLLPCSCIHARSLSLKSK